MTSPLPAQPPREGNEPPQAIAEDHPGWGVKHVDGRWTAWCPAVIVRADTAAALREAIEQAIWGDP